MEKNAGIRLPRRCPAPLRRPAMTGNMEKRRCPTARILCEYQCNGAMAGAKKYHCAPIQIASKVAEKLSENAMFSEVNAVNPGFLNLKLSPDFVRDYLQGMQEDERLGCEKTEDPKTIIIDYGGPNVAKPLHVGHLRSANHRGER